MKHLKFKFDLSSKVAIYVPSTMNVNESCDNSDQVRRVMIELSNMFGGATSTPAAGGWVCQTGELVLENITIVYSYCKDSDLQANFDKIIAICESLKKDMNQEAITLEINGQIAFI